MSVSCSCQTLNIHVVIVLLVQDELLEEQIHEA